MVVAAWACRGRPTYLHKWQHRLLLLLLAGIVRHPCARLLNGRRLETTLRAAKVAEVGGGGRDLRAKLGLVSPTMPCRVNVQHGHRDKGLCATGSAGKVDLERVMEPRLEPSHLPALRRAKSCASMSCPACGVRISWRASGPRQALRGPCFPTAHSLSCAFIHAAHRTPPPPSTHRTANTNGGHGRAARPGPSQRIAAPKDRATRLLAWAVPAVSPGPACCRLGHGRGGRPADEHR